MFLNRRSDRPHAVLGVLPGCWRGLSGPRLGRRACWRKRPGPGRRNRVVVRGRRHAQGLTDRLDPEVLAALVDERAHFGRSVSSSRAKNSEADFKISFALRSSKFSLRSLRISSRSAVVSRSVRFPASTSAWRTRLRNASEPTPRSRATCAIGRPDSSARRTPRSSSSSGYFLDRGITWSSLLEGQIPRFKVSAKTGLAHPAPNLSRRASSRSRSGCATCRYSLFVLLLVGVTILALAVALAVALA